MLKHPAQGREQKGFVLSIDKDLCSAALVANQDLRQGVVVQQGLGVPLNFLDLMLGKVGIAPKCPHRIQNIATIHVQLVGDGVLGVLDQIR